MPWQSNLLRWYQKHRRDLPWRRTKDPYKIWVSEIMLQQTTVATVIPYYEKFLKKFPTVESLAEASEEEVLRLWSGLGYYSRARNLHRAAKLVVRSGGWSRKPTPYPTLLIQELQKLPGIGRYTAGAIASIAFDERAPIVDGNVIRVLSRLFRMAKDPKSSEGQKVFWKKAEEILPDKNCGDFNQALMELGATVCLPENPLCLLCPVSSLCAVRKKGGINDYPVARKKIRYQDVFLTAAVIQKAGKILLVQRPDRGLMKGMWEVPMVEGPIDRLFQTWPVAFSGSLPVVRHSVLNRRLKIQPLLCRLEGKLPPVPHQWIHPSEISQFPTSSMNRKILDALKIIITS